jgi:hypothetical protein
MIWAILVPLVVANLTSLIIVCKLAGTRPRVGPIRRKTAWGVEPEHTC